MFENTYLMAMLGACVALIVVLLLGVLVFGKPGPDLERNEKRLKILRRGAQAVAFGLIVLFVLLRDKF